jgi:hypothetical protein
VQDADHLAVERQRDAGHRARALAQVGAVDLDLREVGDDPRGVVLGDRAGHADTERHADRVELDAHEPDRGACDEHVAVEQQQHRARGADGLGDDPQHLVEQVVEAQVDQPGGRDRLEVADAVGGGAQLLALADQLAVRDDQLVVELEHLLDQALLLADGRLGHEQDRVARAAQPDPALGRGLDAGAGEREHGPLPAVVGGGQPAAEGVALRRLDEGVERAAGDPAAREPLQRRVGLQHGAVRREGRGEHRRALPGVALDPLADHVDAAKCARTAATAASASSA